MTQKIIAGILLLTLLKTTLAQAQTNAANQPPTREKFKVYLLMGQSNMAGRGVPEKEDKTPHPRVLVFTQSNQWQVAVEPLTLGEKKKTPGVGPGLAFAKVMADANPGVSIGLVPCAVGGTPLKRWVKGGTLYENTVARARSSEKLGVLSGVLWHQGEADSGSQTNAESYGDRLTKMIADIRADLNSPKLPFVVGQTGQFNYTRPGDPQPFARLVNETLSKIPDTVPNTGCALSKGLTSKPDLVHFDAASQRELGKRYAAEMLKLEKAQQKPARLKQAESGRKLLK